MRAGKSESVKTAARTLDLFEVFAQAQAPLSLTDLAHRMHAPISSCHALVRTLQSRGYLYVLERRKRVYPTKRMVQIVDAIAAHDPLLDAVGPILAELRDTLGETVILGNRHEQNVIYLEVVEGTHTVRYAARPGDTKPLHSSAIGKAMLGGLEADMVRKLLTPTALKQVTPNTITDLDALMADIEAGRRAGYFATRGENVEDVSAIAIRREIDGEPFGLAIAGPSERMNRKFELYCDELIRQGNALSAL
jgi:DNA-binding IclR family transcriptional regulator